MKEDFKDYLADSQLHIKTTGRNDLFSNTHQYAYEPTDYSVLERVAECGYITNDDVILDYGSGLGRVLFYMHHALGCSGIGIEAVEQFYKLACDNKAQYNQEADIEFFCIEAQKYELQKRISVCFFFNPFSIEVFQTVFAKIKESYYEDPRDIKLFFYYPQDEYVAFLMRDDVFSFEDEIDCMDLFEKEDKRNRVMIFSS